MHTALEQIQQQIHSACHDAGRDPQHVRLLAVSKKQPLSKIQTLAATGHQLFGESYVQELVDKQDQWPDQGQWHFVGALQTNKVKYLVGRVTLIHSVDRLSLGQEIAKQWQKQDLTAHILLQINLAGESQKTGIDPQQAQELIGQLAPLPGLQIRGLMTLPPYAANPEDVRPYFRQLRELATRIEEAAIPGVSMQELSMGMSHDFPVAIAEGATLVRIGTALFGSRPT